MNHRLPVCLLTAATLAACGQPPSPGTPRAVPRTEVTTTTTIAPTTTSADPVPTSPSHQPPPGPPRTTTTTTTKPPPPPPKPPDRWALPASLRGSIEQQTGLPFPGVWEAVQTQLAEVCPGKVPCAGYTLVVDSSADPEGDCVIVSNGISVPDPLHEGGKITFRVNNKNNCTGG